jgi:hypothetical protein
LIDPGKVLEIYASLIAGAVEALSSILLIFMAIIFMLIEAFNMPGKVAAELEAGNDYVRRLADFNVDIRRYVSITTWVGLLTGTLDTIFFMIMGVPLPLLWGMGHSGLSVELYPRDRLLAGGYTADHPGLLGVRPLGRAGGLRGHHPHQRFCRRGA